MDIQAAIVHITGCEVPTSKHDFWVLSECSRCVADSFCNAKQNGTLSTIVLCKNITKQNNTVQTFWFLNLWWHCSLIGNYYSSLCSVCRWHWFEQKNTCSVSLFLFTFSTLPWPSVGRSYDLSTPSSEYSLQPAAYFCIYLAQLTKELWSHLIVGM